MRHDRALWKTLEGKYVWLLCEKKEQHSGKNQQKRKRESTPNPRQLKYKNKEKKQFSNLSK